MDFNEPTSVNHVLPCRKTDGRTGMTKLIVAFRNFANSRNKNRPAESRERLQGWNPI